MHFEPPFDGDYLTTALWKRFLPGWRQREGRSGDIKMAPEEEAKLVAQFNQDMEAPEGPPVDMDDAMFVAMEQFYPVKMGKWRIIEEGVAQRSIEHQKRKKAERDVTSRPEAKPSDADV